MYCGDRDMEGVFRGLPGHSFPLHEFGCEFSGGVRDPQQRNSPQEDCPLTGSLCIAAGCLAGHELGDEQLIRLGPVSELLS